MLYASLYGRFLLLQLENVGSVVVLNFMLACFAIAGALNDRGSDAWWLTTIYGGERVKDAIQATVVSMSGTATVAGGPSERTLLLYSNSVYHVCFPLRPSMSWSW